ncbi:MAG: dethiobiotin synthase [Bacteroidia bacterium]
MKTYFISGIGTDVGKTIASAIVVEALEADYWKPIQAGELHNTDTMKVASLISNKKSVLHKEHYLLTQPQSPHAAAEFDGIEISLKHIQLPATNNILIIEGAGGLMVPLTKSYLVIDLIQQLKAEVILVSKNYLGSINHTLLSFEALKTRNIPIAGIIFNGETNKSSEAFILKYTQLKCLLRINEEKQLTKETIIKYKNAFSIEQT